ncbi:CotO family spore coat protein [Aureibacillus halotolerans]|uniref:Spore coat protein CotO n=1 Tax=Aureibacillus halotolerans TaxID=1508390 RepID=A0A4R6U6M4_9BACI|nr:CotO family spore coat protein [Aureibacillus halotolerans]TDQ42148.1 spore coat protein CotO [Aureibacillus halotolerans]
MQTTVKKPLLYIVQPDFPISTEGMQEKASSKTGTATLPTEQDNEQSTVAPDLKTTATTGESKPDVEAEEKKPYQKERSRKGQFKSLSGQEKLEFLNRLPSVSKPMCEITTAEDTFKGHVYALTANEVSIRKSTGEANTVALDSILDVKILGF